MAEEKDWFPPDPYAAADRSTSADSEQQQQQQQPPWRRNAKLNAQSPPFHPLTNNITAVTRRSLSLSGTDWSDTARERALAANCRELIHRVTKTTLTPSLTDPAALEIAGSSERNVERAVELVHTLAAGEPTRIALDAAARPSAEMCDELCKQFRCVLFDPKTADGSPPWLEAFGPTEALQEVAKRLGGTVQPQPQSAPSPSQSPEQEMPPLENGFGGEVTPGMGLPSPPLLMRTARALLGALSSAVMPSRTAERLPPAVDDVVMGEEEANGEQPRGSSEDNNGAAGQPAGEPTEPHERAESEQGDAAPMEMTAAAREPPADGEPQHPPEERAASEQAGDVPMNATQEEGREEESEQQVASLMAQLLPLVPLPCQAPLAQVEAESVGARIGAFFRDPSAAAAAADAAEAEKTDSACPDDQVVPPVREGGKDVVMATEADAQQHQQQQQEKEEEEEGTPDSQAGGGGGEDESMQPHDTVTDYDQHAAAPPQAVHEAAADESREKAIHTHTHSHTHQQRRTVTSSGPVGYVVFVGLHYHSKEIYLCALEPHTGGAPAEGDDSHDDNTEAANLPTYIIRKCCGSTFFALPRGGRNKAPHPAVTPTPTDLIVNNDEIFISLPFTQATRYPEIPSFKPLLPGQPFKADTLSASLETGTTRDGRVIDLRFQAKMLYVQQLVDTPIAPLALAAFEPDLPTWPIEQRLCRAERQARWIVLKDTCADGLDIMPSREGRVVQLRWVEEGGGEGAIWCLVQHREGARSEIRKISADVLESFRVGEGGLDVIHTVDAPATSFAVYFHQHASRRYLYYRTRQPCSTDEQIIRYEWHQPDGTWHKRDCQATLPTGVPPSTPIGGMQVVVDGASARDAPHLIVLTHGDTGNAIRVYTIDLHLHQEITLHERAKPFGLGFHGRRDEPMSRQELLQCAVATSHVGKKLSTILHPDYQQPHVVPSPPAPATDHHHKKHRLEPQPPPPPAPLEPAPPPPPPASAKEASPPPPPPPPVTVKQEEHADAEGADVEAKVESPPPPAVRKRKAASGGRVPRSKRGKTGSSKRPRTDGAGGQQRRHAKRERHSIQHPQQHHQQHQQQERQQRRAADDVVVNKEEDDDDMNALGYDEIGCADLRALVERHPCEHVRALGNELFQHGYSLSSLVHQLTDMAALTAWRGKTHHPQQQHQADGPPPPSPSCLFGPVLQLFLYPYTAAFADQPVTMMPLADGEEGLPPGRGLRGMTCAEVCALVEGMHDIMEGAEDAMAEAIKEECVSGRAFECLVHLAGAPPSAQEWVKCVARRWRLGRLLLSDESRRDIVMYLCDQGIESSSPFSSALT
ncbi:unnamed protein product [Vitrella brassicaformis CCMP3155]|uniref:Uncharacterized protein n=5 Tax=Vitrella brassicaformis TaxID=1169539 RepID=A0A0G4FS77_VITBC|nr:unnamed protein product [Vitrella brassicaformis CCMP3155]|eukprot:CEM17544.1 unnamed protein product [Vitrella brassicaformis CCMP3155]